MHVLVLTEMNQALLRRGRPPFVRGGDMYLSSGDIDVCRELVPTLPTPATSAPCARTAYWRRVLRVADRGKKWV